MMRYAYFFVTTAVGLTLGFDSVAYPTLRQPSNPEKHFDDVKRIVIHYLGGAFLTSLPLVILDIK